MFPLVGVEVVELGITFHNMSSVNMFSTRNNGSMILFNSNLQYRSKSANPCL